MLKANTCPHAGCAAKQRLTLALTPQMTRRAAAAAHSRAVAQPSCSAAAVQQLRRPQRATHVCRAQKVEDLPASLKKIVGAFQMVPDQMARYKQLLFYATKLEPLPAEDHVPSNKVEGCVSQVWVVPELRDDGKVYWRADSDSQLTKGLAALLVLGLSGCTPAEVLQLQPSFIEMLGLKASLTPSRNNGFLNMFRLMQRKVLELAAAQPAGAAEAPASASASTGANGNGNGNGNGAHAGPTSGAPSTAAAAAPSTSSPPAAAAAVAAVASDPGSRTPLQDGMRRKLDEALRPTRLTIIDESSQHAGHAAMRAVRPAGKAGGNAETHFKVEVVSEVFEGMPLVKRQRMIYQLLDAEFQQMGLHALSLLTRTPAEEAKAGAA